MGNEARCAIRFDGESHEGNALLETEEVILRIGRRVVVPFRALTRIEAHDGEFHLAWAGHEAVIALGASAEKWAEKIRNPKSRLDKIGVKAGQRISVIGVDDPDLAGELAARGLDVSTRQRSASDI